MAGPTDDFVHLARDPASGVEAIEARFAAHAYDLHRHDEWLVGVTEAGVQDFFCRGARRHSTPGRVILIEPHEAHDGEAGTADGFAYRMLYLPRAWVLTGLGAADRDDTIGFRRTLTDDLPLAAAIRTAAAAVLGQTKPQLARDAALDGMLRRLRRCLLGGDDDDGSRSRAVRTVPASPVPARDDRVARRARERLLDAIADNDIGADALAAAAGAADRFHLARAFRAAYGTAPHAYLVQMRLLRARALLAGGEPPAAVAAACGFADQSHLGRWFRRAFGVASAAYRKLCTGVPDAAAAIE